MYNVEFYQLPYEPDEYLAMVEKELEALFPTCDFGFCLKLVARII